MMIQRILHRELTLHYREPRQILYSCLFFFMVLIFFPLTISTAQTTLRNMAPGVIWIDMLFAFFLSAERLFQQDYDDGVIEQWILSNHSLGILLTAKIFMHWFLNVIPMIVLSPLVGIFFHLNAYETFILMISLFCGTPAILFLCALAAAFGAGLKREGILMALIVFPLTIPSLLLGSGTLQATLQGLPVQGYLALLSALSIIAVSFLPIAIAAVVRINLAE